MKDTYITYDVTHILRNVSQHVVHILLIKFLTGNSRKDTVQNHQDTDFKQLPANTVVSSNRNTLIDQPPHAKPEDRSQATAPITSHNRLHISTL